MHHRVKWITSVLLMLLLLLYVRFASRGGRLPPVQAPSGEEVALPSESATVRSAGVLSTNGAEQGFITPPNGDIAYARLRQREFMKKGSNFDWERPINFYGQVFDENDAPLEGVRVDFAWNDLSPEGTSRSITASDANGLFSLLSKTGKILSVGIKKDGYYVPTAQRLRNFEYADPYDETFLEPDPKKPILFHLRKQGKAEPLIVMRNGYNQPGGGEGISACHKRSAFFH